MVGRDSVDPQFDFLGKSHGSTESRPTSQEKWITFGEVLRWNLRDGTGKLSSEEWKMCRASAAGLLSARINL